MVKMNQKSKRRLLGINLFLFALLFGLISLVPGGLGVRDAIWVFIYTRIGIPVDYAISIALINRILRILVAVMILIILHPLCKFSNRNQVDMIPKAVNT